MAAPRLAAPAARHGHAQHHGAAARRLSMDFTTPTGARIALALRRARSSGQPVLASLSVRVGDDVDPAVDFL